MLKTASSSTAVSLRSLLPLIFEGARGLVLGFREWNSRDVSSIAKSSSWKRRAKRGSARRLSGFVDNCPSVWASLVPALAFLVTAPLSPPFSNTRLACRLSSRSCRSSIFSAKRLFTFVFTFLLPRILLSRSVSIFSLTILFLCSSQTKGSAINFASS